MKAEIVYLGHNNSIDLILKSDGDAADLSLMTKMTLTVGSTLVSSTNQGGDTIRWAQPEYDTGEVRLYLGGLSLVVGTYHAPLVVYDNMNADGVVWGTVLLSVKAEVEAAGA